MNEDHSPVRPMTPPGDVASEAASSRLHRPEASGVSEILERVRDALKERYEIEREIGRGGMAIVFLAKDFQLPRRVAIKVLRPEFVRSDTARRFLREIHIEAGLQHPNIVTLFDSGQADGLPYFVMEYVEGESLRDRLVREGQFSLETTLAISRQVAEGLAYAHERKVVHRDIKPENILLSGDRALIADFGIARAAAEAGVESITPTDIVLGTPQYMSPEQCGADPTIDHRTDIYSLACVVYEMLAGEPPFTGRTRSAIVAKQLHERVPSLAIVRQNIPHGMAVAIEKALEKVPADRFSGVHEFIEALEAGRDTVTTVVSGVRFARTKTGLLVAAVLASLALGLRLLWPGSPIELASNRVMLFPMRESGLNVLGPGIGLRAALRIGSALEQTDPLRFEWGWPWLSQAERNDVRELSAPRADSIARARHARYRIDAELVEQGQLANVILWLYDVRSDSLVVQRTATGIADPDSVLRLALHAAGQVLPYVIVEPGRTLDTSAFVDRDLTATALWMQGEEEYRRSRFASALALYKRAVEADSALSMAALKGAQAASWIHSDADVDAMIAVALAGASSLPERHLLYANGIRFWEAGNADSAVSSLRGALALDSTWSDAWMALGEVYYHLVTGEPGVDSLAGHAFEKALDHDPAFTPALIHLTEQVIRRGEIDRARGLIARFGSGEEDSARVASFRLMLECVEDGPENVDWKDLARADPQEALAGAVVLGTAGSQPGCAEAAYRAVLRSAAGTVSQRWGAWLGLQSLLMAQRRFSDLEQALDSVADDITRSAQAVLMMDLHAGAPFEVRADAIARQRCGDLSSTSTPVLWLCTLWGNHKDSAAVVQGIAQVMRSRLAGGSRRDSMVAKIVEAYAALAIGDSTAAIRRFTQLNTSAVSADIRWQPWESLAAERMVLARLLLARQDYEGAHRVASLLDDPQPVVYLAYLVPSLSVREIAAREMGQRELAAGYRRRLALLQSQ
jgi:tetratricopeptide (TPR) repeat protein